MESFRRALALNANLADAYNNMGNALKDLGRLKESEQAYLKALDLDPDVAGVYVNLADSIKFSRGSPHLAHMKALAAKGEGLSTTERLQLDFALGKAYADLEDYPRSFAHYQRGNAAKRALIAYDETTSFALFDRIETVFSRDFFARRRGGGDPSDRPLFIVGMPRSGTTLVEQIVASHPLVAGAGELMAPREAVEFFAAAGGAAFPDFATGIDEAGLRRLAGDYLERLQRIAAQGARATDKMPSNYLFIGLIHLALPNARIIHCTRDPIDNCLSCFTKLFSSEQNDTFDLGELGRHYRRYERLMTHWREVLPPGAFIDARYEEVVDDLESTVRKILDHCGLPWDPRCLDFDKNRRPVRTASATQVRKPIYRSSIGRWRVYEKELKPLLAALAIAR